MSVWLFPLQTDLIPERNCVFLYEETAGEQQTITQAVTEPLLKMGRG